MRVLVVEDDPKMAAAMKRAMQAAGAVVDTTGSAEDAEWMVRDRGYTKPSSST